MRVLVAAIIGGLVMLAWGIVAHEWLELGSRGLTVLPKEDSVIAELKSAIPADGLYYFPGLDPSRAESDEEKRAWDERHRKGPTGLIVFHPQGSEPFSVRRVLLELATNVVAALCIALLLAYSPQNILGRTLLAALAGIGGWLSISGSHWIWYGFPTEYVVTEGIMQAAGWGASGFAMALVLGAKRGK